VKRWVVRVGLRLALGVEVHAVLLVRRTHQQWVVMLGALYLAYTQREKGRE
jgi:hypothetical protein